MRPPYHFRKEINGMVPASHNAQEWFSKTRLGQVCELLPRRPRNPAHHRKYWALLSIVAENTDQYDSAEQIHYVIKAWLHYGKWVKVEGAKTPLFIADSTSFENMDQEEFSEFYPKALRIAQKLLPKDAAGNPIELADLEQAIEQAA